MTLMTERPGSTRCRPRFATPRDENFPTYGGQVGEIARRLGKPLMPWQQDLIDVAYEYDPESGLFRYSEVDDTVPRQSGKTTLVLAKKVHRLTVMARQLGPQRSTYTAQTRLAARKKLERDFAEALRHSPSFREVPNAKARPTKATEWRLSLNNGSEAIQFGSGSFLQIDAPSRTGGHGDVLDDGTIDEAFSHEDDTVEAAMRPAMSTRPNAQLWVISTAGDARSKYLWRKVLAGRAASLSGNHGKVCYVEYSAPEDSDPGDPATWWDCMPALGITVSEDFIRGEWERAQRKGQEGIDTFCRAYLNMWPDVPVLDDSDREQVLPGWANLLDPESKPVDPLTFTIDVTPGRDAASVAVAAERPDGLIHTEVVRSAAGTDWVVDLIDSLRGSWRCGPIRVLSKEPLALELDRRGIAVHYVTPSEYAQACGGLLDLVSRGGIRWNGADATVGPLLAAVRAARKKAQGEAFTWARKDSTDISPLVAVTLAAHGVRADRDRPGRFFAL